MLSEQSLRIRDKNGTQFYQFGNKPGQLLAIMLKQQPLTPIIKIQKTSGEITYDPMVVHIILSYIIY